MASSQGDENKTWPKMKRNLRNVLKPQLRYCEIPLYQAVCKMHSAREPREEKACGVAMEKQEKLQFCNTSEEISVLGRNWILSLSPCLVLCYLFCNDLYRLRSGYCIRRVQKVHYRCHFCCENISSSVNQKLWPCCMLWGQAFLPPEKSAFEKDGLTKCVPICKTADVSQARRGGRDTVWELLSSWPLKNTSPLYGRKFSASWSCQRWFSSCWVLCDSSQSSRMKLGSGTQWLLPTSPATALGTAACTHVMWISKSLVPTFCGLRWGTAQCWGLRWGTCNCSEREDVPFAQQLVSLLCALLHRMSWIASHWPRTSRSIADISSMCSACYINGKISTAFIRLPFRA